MKKNKWSSLSSSSLEDKDNHSTMIGGQRYITSAFRNPFSNSQGGDAKTKTPKKLSFSDFLNRKLNNMPNPPQNTKNLITPLVAHGDRIECNEVNKDLEKGFETDKFPLEFVLEEFKCTDSHKEDPVSLSFNEEVGNSNMIDMLESRKRKNPPTLITIGDDPKPSHLNLEEKREMFIVGKKPKHLFNHYGNGKGWWDGNMEGVDDEEVGSVETWEGVGSSTIGGLEWH